MHRAAVIGLGRFGMTLARELVRYGAEVIAIDTDEGHVAEIRPLVSVAVVADGADEKALSDLGVASVDVAVVSMGDNFEAMQLAVVTLKRRLRVKRVVAKATNPLRENILRKIGCDEVVSPEREAAMRLAHHLVLPRILEQVALGPGKALVQVEAPPAMVGKELREIDARSRFGINIVAIKRRLGPDGKPVPARKAPAPGEAGRGVTPLAPGAASPGDGPAGEVTEDVKVVPMPSDVILEGDVLVVIGDDEGINRMAE
jgi:trk system potassium uptake protein TrkA